MGFMDKLFPGKPLSYFAKQEGTQFHDATCDLCGSSFSWLETGVAYPIPLSASRTKPAPHVLDIGGWCVKCDRMVCPKEADFVPFTLEGDDWWVAGCRGCQQPLGGRWNLADHKSKSSQP